MAAKQDDDAILAERIRTYLRDHPNAADTLEGVALWWLSDNTSSDRLAAIQHAIDTLVVAGEVNCQALPDRSVVISARRKNSSS